MRQFLRDRNALTSGLLWYGAFVVWGIVPNDVNDTFVRVSGLDFGKKLNRSDPIDGGWFNEGRIKVFQVESSVNVHAPAPRCRLDGGV